MKSLSVHFQSNSSSKAFRFRAQDLSISSVHTACNTDPKNNISKWSVHRLSDWTDERIGRMEQKRWRKNKVKWFYIIKYNSMGMNVSVRLAACVVLVLLCLWGHILKSGNMFWNLRDSPVADQFCCSEHVGKIRKVIK